MADALPSPVCVQDPGVLLGYHVFDVRGRCKAPGLARTEDQVLGALVEGSGVVFERLSGSTLDGLSHELRFGHAPDLGRPLHAGREALVDAHGFDHEAIVRRLRHFMYDAPGAGGPCPHQ